MQKTAVILGGILGATVALLAFTFVLIPPPEYDKPGEIIVSNGHDPSAVGQETPIAGTRDLSLIQIFEKSEAGVVQVNIQRATDVLGTNGVGSGFVFDKNGHVITNEHVVSGAQRVVVTFLDGRSYNAEVIGVDAATDIAVVQVEADSDLLKPLHFGDSSNLKVGMEVAAIGNPFGLSGTMTSGIVSALGRLLPQETGFSIPDVIQTDAAINPGNSGGPLLNSRGEVIGINTAIQSATGEFTGVGFAVPSNTLARIVPSLIISGSNQ